MLCHAAQAQALLQQLERRKLYKYVSEVTLDVNAQHRYNTSGGKPTAEEIVGYQSTAETGVSGLPGGGGLWLLLLRLQGRAALCGCTCINTPVRPTASGLMQGCHA